MLSLNFYKIRTGLDIRIVSQGGTLESSLRYDQIIQTIQQRSEIEWLSDNIFQIIERGPADLKAYSDTQLTVYILIFALDKSKSSWTASDLTKELGNMRLTSRILDENPDAEPWIGGLENNISCEKCLFDLRTVKKKTHK